MSRLFLVALGLILLFLLSGFGRLLLRLLLNLRVQTLHEVVHQVCVGQLRFLLVSLLFCWIF